MRPHAIARCFSHYCEYVYMSYVEYTQNPRPITSDIIFIFQSSAKRGNFIDQIKEIGFYRTRRKNCYNILIV